MLGHDVSRRVVLVGTYVLSVLSTGEPAMQKNDTEFQTVLYNSVLVKAVYNAGGDDKDVIVHQDKLIQSLVARLVELELIAPRKIKVGGTVYIYRCPDHLVP
jgi:hypothetical protein